MPPLPTPPRLPTTTQIEIHIDPETPYRELIEGHLLQMAAVGKRTGIIQLNRNGLAPITCLAENLQLWVVDWTEGRLDRGSPECIAAIAALWQRTTAAVRAGDFTELMLEGVHQAIAWDAVSRCELEALQECGNLYGLEAIAPANGRETAVRGAS